MNASSEGKKRDISTYLRTYRIGEMVDIVVNGAIQKGMPHKNYHGKTGRIFNINLFSWLIKIFIQNFFLIISPIFF